MPQELIENPESQGLKPIRGPKGTFGILLASTAGFMLLLCPTLFLCMAASQIALHPSESQTISLDTSPWTAMVLALLLYIPLHEGVHLLCQPGMGRGPNSMLICMPAKLRFGVYYKGSMNRTRWLVMRLAPFILLTLIPVCFLAIVQNLPIYRFPMTMIEVITVVNGVGSGADVVAALVVLFQVPRSASIVFQGGRAYWRPGRQPAN